MIATMLQLGEDEQREIVRALKQSIRPLVNPLSAKRMPRFGTAFRYKCTNLGDYGWHSDIQGYRYVSVHPVTQCPFPCIPDCILRVVQRVQALTNEPDFLPQSCLVNVYRQGDTLGTHQDKTEQNKQAMIVSISLGCDGLFTIGKPITETRTLSSGDVMVMAGPDRMAWHGMAGVLPYTGPQIGLPDTVRVNLTIRQVK